ncbi:MAG TPA: hypothetical protein VN706_08705 [Gemmatimonadaceae bacterium]|nr:hypothetical protein [Gemmatimonadaceae bacterium]
MTSVRDLTRTPAMRIAFVAVVATSAALLWEVVQAVRTPPLPEIPAATLASVTAQGSLHHMPSPPPADIQAAVDNDLFASDRSAPDTPYRMPGESTEDDKVAAEPAKPFVLGTAVGNDGRNFATLQLGTESPKLVVVGDKIGEWVVKGISRGKVVLLSSTGTRAELTVTKPGT